MYNNKLAVALKSNGKVLREFKDEVYVPFGNEYSIFIKNLNSVRALATVTVDGVDVGDGTRFVIDPNDSIDIERFIKNGNLDEGNRLKFIERTQNIEKHKGIGIEDGLVRVEFNFEKVVPEYVPPFLPIVPQPRRWNDPWNDTHIWYTHTIGGDIAGSNVRGTGAMGNSTFTTTCDAAVPVQGEVHDGVACNNFVGEIQNDAGITVPGEISDQQFNVASWFATEAQSHVVVLKILGETKDNVQVTKPVTVKAKPKCSTCNRTNKATAKFCTECGTSLQIV
jgi:hypothetical protein